MLTTNPIRATVLVERAFMAALILFYLSGAISNSFTRQGSLARALCENGTTRRTMRSAVVPGTLGSDAAKSFALGDREQPAID